jgi:dTDP-4-dehydrorhamnose reductase
VRILVTGVSGQVGSAIARSFSGLGSIIAADRTVIDLSRPYETTLAFLVNASGPEALARWAAPRSVPLVHFSTNYVFSGSGEKPWREDDPARPLGNYGASKLAGEDAVRSAAGPHLIIRTAWVYAANGTNFLRTIARLAREREELHIVADQIGSPTSAAYIADSLVKLFHRNLADLPQVFESANYLVNLTADGQTSWHGFACAIVAGLKRRGIPVATQRVIEIATKDYPTKVVRPLNSRLDLSRLRQVFDITPQRWEVLLETELDRFVEASQYRW